MPESTGIENTAGAAGLLDGDLFAIAGIAVFFDGFDSAATRFAAGFFAGMYSPSILASYQLLVGAGCHAVLTTLLDVTRVLNSRHCTYPRAPLSYMLPPNTPSRSRLGDGVRSQASDAAALRFGWSTASANRTLQRRSCVRANDCDATHTVNSAAKSRPSEIAAQ